MLWISRVYVYKSSVYAIHKDLHKRCTISGAILYKIWACGKLWAYSQVFLWISSELFTGASLFLSFSANSGPEIGLENR